jgi:hypothetical protein
MVAGAARDTYLEISFSRLGWELEINDVFFFRSSNGVGK